MIAGRDWSGVQVVGVTRLASYLRRKLEADPKLTALGVEGEISNLRVQVSGSWNFSLKDRDAVIECFAYPSDAATFPAARNGDALVCYGRISTYEKKSTYQLQVRHVELAGIGRLYARYEELRRKLDAEGLFAQGGKRALPRFPFRVALVGSASGEGTRDFLSQARARAPQVTVQLVETPVQGEAAAPQIAAALERACASGPDLVVLARGGGSFEDLFVFSDERVVRAVARCPIPIVTAIGHEADMPLADLAADVRAATPSTAAQTVLPRRDELLRELERDARRIARALQVGLNGARAKLERIEHRSPLADPSRLLFARRQRLDGAAGALGRAGEAALRRLRERLRDGEKALAAHDPAARVQTQRVRFDHLAARLGPAAFTALNRRHGELDALAEALPALALGGVGRRHDRLRVLGSRLAGLNPQLPLERGFALVARARDGAIVRDPADAPPGTQLRVSVARGVLAARVEPEGSDGGEQIGLF